LAAIFTSKTAVLEICLASRGEGRIPPPNPKINEGTDFCAAVFVRACGEEVLVEEAVITVHIARTVHRHHLTLGLIPSTYQVARPPWLQTRNLIAGFFRSFCYLCCNPITRLLPFVSSFIIKLVVRRVSPDITDWPEIAYSQP
jgi:hypothetical protein